MASATEVKIFPKPKKVAKAVAREIRKMTEESERNRFDIALSGGNTPKKLFKILAKKHKEKIRWEFIHFWWGDERCVSPVNDDSNFKMANDFLFSHVPVPSKNIHRMKGENPPADEAGRYASEMNKNMISRDGAPVFDLILLGLGSDGHTASIFPGQLELFTDERNCVATKHPETGQNRITLSGKVLNNAEKIFIMVTGENKAARLAEIMNNEETAKLLPAFYIEPKYGSAVWFADEKAASKIT